MRIKRYVANNMQQAVAMVKGDLGEEAVILNTKRFKRGGVFGLFGRPKVEIVAAIEPGKQPVQRRHEAELHRAQQTTAAALDSLQEEVRSLRRMLGEQARNSAPAPAGVQAALERLAEQEFSESDAYELLDQIGTDAEQQQLEDVGWVWERLTEHVAAGIATAPPWQFADTPLIVPLVGPTGVGKTTTIAKLAANFKMLAHKKVGLVTVDTYRVAAVEQLRTYANIIGIDLHVAYTPVELEYAVDRLADHDLILVDTAGRSQNNVMHMGELRAFLDVLRRPQVHLVVSANTRGTDLDHIATRFADCSYERLIVTKIDETSTFGSLYRLPRLTGKPLAYVTHGQSVLDAIDPADGEHAARLILGMAP